MSFALLIPLVLYVFYYRVRHCQKIAGPEICSCESIILCAKPASPLCKRYMTCLEGFCIAPIVAVRVIVACGPKLNRRPLHMQVYVQKELKQLAKSKKENGVDGAPAWL